MKKNRFKPSPLHPIKRYRYNQRVKAAGVAWTNMSLAISKLGEQLVAACKPLEEVARNLEASKSKHPSHFEPGFNKDGSLAEISLVKTKK